MSCIIFPEGRVPRTRYYLIGYIPITYLLDLLQINACFDSLSWVFYSSRNKPFASMTTLWFSNEWSEEMFWLDGNNFWMTVTQVSNPHTRYNYFVARTQTVHKANSFQLLSPSVAF